MTSLPRLLPLSQCRKLGLARVARSIVSAWQGLGCGSLWRHMAQPRFFNLMPSNTARLVNCLSFIIGIIIKHSTFYFNSRFRRLPHL